MGATGSGFKGLPKTDSAPSSHLSPGLTWCDVTALDSPSDSFLVKGQGMAHLSGVFRFDPVSR